MFSARQTIKTSKATKTRFLHCKPLDSIEPFPDPKEYEMAFMADREINRHQLFHH